MLFDFYFTLGRVESKPKTAELALSKGVGDKGLSAVSVGEEPPALKLGTAISLCIVDVGVHVYIHNADDKVTEGDGAFRGRGAGHAARVRPVAGSEYRGHGQM